MKKTLLTLIILLGCYSIWGQFPPQAGVPGNDAISKDDNNIVAWASGCTVKRGWKNIADTSLGKASAGSPENATGTPGLRTVSLGDGGVAVLTFESPIKNGNGADFAVFENGFQNPQDLTQAYLELALVAVSSDGHHYVTFPATSLTQDTVQIDNATYMYAKKVNNLAGKYVKGYGTPFDLAELVDSPNLDINHIRFVRITDVVGSLDTAYASFDKDGHIINDPFPTPFPTGGFDLNAVGVLHQQATGINPVEKASSLKLWPIPARDIIHFKSNIQTLFYYVLYNMSGQKLYSGFCNGETNINIANFPSGLYFLKYDFYNGQRGVLDFVKL